MHRGDIDVQIYPMQLASLASYPNPTELYC